MEPLVLLHGKHKIGKWELSIKLVDKSWNPTYSITVYGFNGIEFGHFKIEYKNNSKDGYVPAFKFYNKMSMYGSLGYIDSDTLSTVVLEKIDKTNGYYISLQDFIDAVEESWGKIKKFLNQNICG